MRFGTADREDRLGKTNADFKMLSNRPTAQMRLGFIQRTVVATILFWSCIPGASTAILMRMMDIGSLAIVPPGRCDPIWIQ